MKYVIIGLITIYQVVKPVFHQVMITVFGVAPTCKYQESCSNYTVRMLKKHGTIDGLRRGFQRVITCWG